MSGSVAMVFFRIFSNDWKIGVRFGCADAVTGGSDRVFQSVDVDFVEVGAYGMGRRGASLVNFGMSRFGFMLGRRLGLRQGFGDELAFTFGTAGDVEAGEAQDFFGGG